MMLFHQSNAVPPTMRVVIFTVALVVQQAVILPIMVSGHPQDGHPRQDIPERVEVRSEDNGIQFGYRLPENSYAMFQFSNGNGQGNFNRPLREAFSELHQLGEIEDIAPGPPPPPQQKPLKKILKKKKVEVRAPFVLQQDQSSFAPTPAFNPTFNSDASIGSSPPTAPRFNRGLNPSSKPAFESSQSSFHPNRLPNQSGKPVFENFEGNFEQNKFAKPAGKPAFENFQAFNQNKQSNPSTSSTFQNFQSTFEQNKPPSQNFQSNFNQNKPPNQNFNPPFQNFQDTFDLNQQPNPPFTTSFQKFPDNSGQSKLPNPTLQEFQSQFNPAKQPPNPSTFTQTVEPIQDNFEFSSFEQDDQGRNHQHHQESEEVNTFQHFSRSTTTTPRTPRPLLQHRPKFRDSNRNVETEFTIEEVKPEIEQFRVEEAIEVQEKKPKALWKPVVEETPISGEANLEEGEFIEMENKFKQVNSEKFKDKRNTQDIIGSLTKKKPFKPKNSHRHRLNDFRPTFKPSVELSEDEVDEDSVSLREAIQEVRPPPQQQQLSEEPLVLNGFSKENGEIIVETDNASVNRRDLKDDSKENVIKEDVSKMKRTQRNIEGNDNELLSKEPQFNQSAVTQPTSCNHSKEASAEELKPMLQRQVEMDSMFHEMDKGGFIPVNVPSSLGVPDSKDFEAFLKEMDDHSFESDDDEGNLNSDEKGKASHELSKESSKDNSTEITNAEGTSIDRLDLEGASMELEDSIEDILKAERAQRSIEVSAKQPQLDQSLYSTNFSNSKDSNPKETEKVKPHLGLNSVFRQVEFGGFVPINPPPSLGEVPQRNDFEEFLKATENQSFETEEGDKDDEDDNLNPDKRSNAAPEQEEELLKEAAVQLESDIDVLSFLTTGLRETLKEDLSRSEQCPSNQEFQELRENFDLCQQHLPDCKEEEAEKLSTVSLVRSTENRQRREIQTRDDDKMSSFAKCLIENYPLVRRLSSKKKKEDEDKLAISFKSDDDCTQFVHIFFRHCRVFIPSCSLVQLDQSVALPVLGCLFVRYPELMRPLIKGEKN